MLFSFSEALRKTSVSASALRAPPFRRPLRPIRRKVKSLILYYTRFSEKKKAAADNFVRKTSPFSPFSDPADGSGAMVPPGFRFRPDQIIASAFRQTGSTGKTCRKICSFPLLASDPIIDYNLGKEQKEVGPC